MRTCDVPGCDSNHFAKGYCRKHHTRWLRNGDPTVNLKTAIPTPCRVDGCEKLARCRGLCDKHYIALRRHGDPLVKLSNYGEPADVRFWQKVDRSAGDAACWPWTGGTGGYGHGIFYTEAGGGLIHAHKWLWEQMNGPVPPGLELDHLCRTPGCVNPAHMEAVTHRENVLRGNAPTALNAVKTHCPSGHAYDQANTYVGRDGSRRCRACARAYQRERRARLRITA